MQTFPPKEKAVYIRTKRRARIQIPHNPASQSAQLQASIDPQINSSQEQISSVNVPNNVTRSPVTAQYPIVRSFDGWNGELEEFQETCLPLAVREMSVADALYKLEASKDIPFLKLTAFNGNPLRYVEFIEQSKIHIHDKCHLTDDSCMVQLKMLVTGDGARIIPGLACQGMMMMMMNFIHVSMYLADANWGHNMKIK